MLYYIILYYIILYYIILYYIILYYIILYYIILYYIILYYIILYHIILNQIKLNQTILYYILNLLHVSGQVAPKGLHFRASPWWFIVGALWSSTVGPSRFYAICALRVPCGCFSRNSGSFFWVSLHIGVHIRAPDSWKLLTVSMAFKGL